MWEKLRKMIKIHNYQANLLCTAFKSKLTILYNQKVQTSMKDQWQKERNIQNEFLTIKRRVSQIQSSSKYFTAMKKIHFHWHKIYQKYKGTKKNHKRKDHLILALDLKSFTNLILWKRLSKVLSGQKIGRKKVKSLRLEANPVHF